MAKEQIGSHQWSSYNQLIEVKVDFDELIYVLSPDDLPLQTGRGSNGLAVVPTVPVTQREFHWQDEDVPLPVGSLNGALTDVATAVIVQDNEAVKFPVGSTIRVDDEAMRVTAINTSTHTLTVTRGANGTTNVVHSDDAAVIGIGTSLPEGDVGQGAFRGRDKFSNYTQIFSRKFGVTNTELLIAKYGVPSELARQTANIGLHLHTEVELSGLYGIRYNDDASEVRSTGGLAHYITSNINSTDDWLTVESIETQQEGAYNAGGMFEMVMARPDKFKALNNIVGNERVQNVSTSDTMRGRSIATQVMTEYGVVDLVRNRWVNASDAFGYTRSQFVKRVLRPFSLGGLAKTDDRENYLLVGELGWEVKGQEHMTRWSSLDASAALPSSGLV